MPEILSPSEAAGLWTASSVVERPAETFTATMITGFSLIHLAAFLLLAVGIVYSLRHRRKAAVTSYLCGLAVAAAGFTGVAFAKNHLDPSGLTTYAYAYTGDRLSTVLYDETGIRDEAIVEGQITEIAGARMPDGNMLVMATFTNGQVVQMMLGLEDTTKLVEALSTMHEGRNSIHV